MEKRVIYGPDAVTPEWQGTRKRLNFILTFTPQICSEKIFEIAFLKNSGPKK